MNDAAYRASRLVVMRQIMYPMQPTPMGPEDQPTSVYRQLEDLPEKWNARSCVLSECQALTNDPMAAKMYGGADRQLIDQVKHIAGHTSK
jgi:hypothetical protein